MPFKVAHLKKEKEKKEASENWFVGWAVWPICCWLSFGESDMSFPREETVLGTWKQTEQEAWPWCKCTCFKVQIVYSWCRQLGINALVLRYRFIPGAGRPDWKYKLGQNWLASFSYYACYGYILWFQTAAFSWLFGASGDLWGSSQGKGCLSFDGWSCLISAKRSSSTPMMCVSTHSVLIPGLDWPCPRWVSWSRNWTLWVC